MKILVAIDSSTYADEVLEQLTARPWPAASEFQIVSAVECCANWETGEEMRNQCKGILERRIDYLRKRLPEVKITGGLLEGPAGAVITNFAEAWGADLVVIGSHGDTGKRMREIGSVAAQVVNKASCTVEVIKLRGCSSANSVKAAVARRKSA